MNNHDSKFMNGLFLGALIGGAAVFFAGTRTGRNLVKIVSEQGLDGLSDLLEEYDLSAMDEENEYEDRVAADENHTNQNEDNIKEKEEVKSTAKKRFFRRK
jgi:hypothetical protein